METIDDLKQRFTQSGTVTWIGLSSERMNAIESVSQADVLPGTGLNGDHHATSGKSKRQVTFIQQEHLTAVAGLIGRDEVLPELVRRNVVVSGINLLALKDQKFRIGEALFEGSGPCVPCSRMEQNLGFGGYNAMRGHGGITAKVIEGGTVSVGDSVEPIIPDAE